MKVIVAGGRDFYDYDFVKNKLDYFFKNEKPEEIVSGKCSVGVRTFVDDEGNEICGVDGLGERYAKENNIPVKPFFADWSKGKKGGYLRNKKMAMYGNAAIVFWDKKSRGSAMMIKLATQFKLNLRVVNY